MNLDNFLNFHTIVNLKNQYDRNYYVSNYAHNYNTFKRNGYVVIRNFLNKKDINQIKFFYKKLIVNNKKANLFRQDTGNVEKNNLTNKNFLLNPIQNIQDLENKKFGPYIDIVKKVVMSQRIKKLVSFFLKSEPLMIQTMQFEVDPRTPPHHDGYYMNSKFKKGMVGIWFALEDIKKEAGRFFLIGKSHFKNKSNSEKLSINTDHKKYLNKMKRAVIQNRDKISAPFLKKGDIIIWDSNTIHGSAGVLNKNYSRFSLTAHYIKNDNFYFKGSNKCNIKKNNYKNFLYSKNKDNSLFSIMILMKISQHFPNFYKKLKLYLRNLLK